LNEVNIQPNYFVLKKNMEIKDSAPKDEKTHTRHIGLCAVSGTGDVLTDAQTNASEWSLVALYALGAVIGFEREHVDGSDVVGAGGLVVEGIGYRVRVGEDSDRFRWR
jgi:hypothetical protein